MPSTAQTVENIRPYFDQSNQLMIIKYDLTGFNYRKEIKVVPYYGLGTGSLKQMQSVSGDTSWLSKGGKNKQIIWNPFKDGVDSLNGLKINLVPQVRNAAIHRFWGVAMQGSNSAPFGLKVMRLNPIGYFAGFRVGKFPPAYRYNVDVSGRIDYLESGVYEIGSKRRLVSYAVTAGPIYQITRNFYAYAGAGYGVEQLFWNYNAYNLDYNLIGTDWALVDYNNRQGITVDAGFIIRFGRVIADFGTSAIQFESFQIIGGIGYLISNN